MGKRKKAEEATLDLLIESVEKLTEEVARLKRRIERIENRPPPLDPLRPIGPRPGTSPWEPRPKPPPYPWQDFPPREPIRVTFTQV